MSCFLFSHHLSKKYFQLNVKWSDRTHFSRPTVLNAAPYYLAKQEAAKQTQTTITINSNTK